MTIKKNSRFEILTDSGWSDFDGVRKKIAKGIATLHTARGKILNCTANHLILSDNEFVEAKSLRIGDMIVTDDGVEAVTYIDINENIETEVYDALEVYKNNRYYTNGVLSHNCQFLGSSGTLISGAKLKELSPSRPLAQIEGLTQYEKPEKGHTYVVIVDVSRGKGLDYSAFSVIDITSMPYKQVCTFKDNFIGPVDYASTIHRVLKAYNEAYVLIEINDIGAQVADVLYMDFGYENTIFTENAGRMGKRVSGGFGKSVDRGIRTTKSVKTVGCSILKMLIEQNQLLIPDFNTIQELSRFSKKGNSYEAEPGAHDDLVMTLVLFAWLSDQTYFRDLTDINTMSKLREKTEEQIDEELLPFGFVYDGREEVEEYRPTPSFMDF